MEKASLTAWKVTLGTVGKVFTEQSVRELFAGCMKAGILSQEDTSLACGWCPVILFTAYVHLGALPSADEVGVFRAAVDLYARVEPSPLTADWWSRTFTGKILSWPSFTAPDYTISRLRPQPGVSVSAALNKF